MSDDLAAQLEVLLPAFLRRQRWFGASAEGIKVTSIEELQPPWPGLLRVVVRAGADRYQVLLGLHPLDRNAAASFGEAMTVGAVRLAQGDALCFEASVDAELAIALLQQVCPTETVTDARPIGVEQSNTSIVYDERLILKVFRRLAGRNPEIEVGVGLAAHGFTHIAEPIAVWANGDDDIGLLQRFLVGGCEGWALALTSIRDALDHEGDPTEAGGDLGPESERLGEMTAAFHLAMAAAFGVSKAVPDEWADLMESRMSTAAHPGLDLGLVRQRFDVIRSIADAGASIRIHGDFHLGQVMRTDQGWYVLDFEGEPTRPAEERARHSSPLRDVAGMLRSFSYAANAGVRDHASVRADAQQQAAAWEDHNRQAFLRGYERRLEGSGLLPPDPTTRRVLLGAFELDKAVYEVMYEQTHRPDWVEIPLAAVRRLVEVPL